MTERKKGAAALECCPCEKLKYASQCYAEGCSCSQAVFRAFAEDIEDIGLDETIVYRIMEEAGGEFGAMQEVCGAFLAAAAVISFYMSNGSMDGESKARTYKAIRRAAEIYRQEYGAIRCRDILHGDRPEALPCRMKIKDAVLMVYKVLGEEDTHVWAA